MGFFSGLNTEKYDRQYTDKVLIKRVSGYFRPQWKRLVGIGFLVILISGAGTLQPIIVSHGVDLLQQSPSYLTIFEIAGAVLLVGVTGWSANWINRRLTMRTVADVVLSLATDAFQASAGHDLSFFDEFSSGRIQSRITSDTRDFGQLVTMITDLCTQVFEAVILGVVLVRIDWRLALYAFALIPVILALAISYRNLARNVTRRGMQAMANVNSTIKETVSGIAVAKNFRQEASIYHDFDAANQTSYKVNVRRGLTLAIVFPT